MKVDFVQSGGDAECQANHHADHLQLHKMHVEDKQVGCKIVRNTHVHVDTERSWVGILVTVSGEILRDHVEEGAEEDHEVDLPLVVNIGYMFRTDATSDKVYPHSYGGEETICELDHCVMYCFEASASYSDRTVTNGTYQRYSNTNDIGMFLLERAHIACVFFF